MTSATFINYTILASNQLGTTDNLAAVTSGLSKITPGSKLYQRTNKHQHNSLEYISISELFDVTESTLLLSLHNFEVSASQ